MRDDGAPRNHEDDDQQWLDALARRGTVDSEAAREAKALRHAYLQHSSALPIVDLPPPVAGLERFMTAARESGLLEDTQQSSLPHRFIWRLGLTLAASICTGIVINFTLLNRPAAPTLRSPVAGVVRLESATPNALKQSLLRDLSAAGATADGYEQLGLQGIDVEFPVPLDPKLAAVFQHYGIALPTGDELQIEIVPTTTR